MADATGAVVTGASVANPWLGIASGFASGLGSSMNRSGGPSSAYGQTESVFDNSGWNVNFGSGGISSTSDKTTGTGAMGQYLPYFIAAVGAIILWRMTRKKG